MYNAKTLTESRIFDLETAPKSQHFSIMSERMRQLWEGIVKRDYNSMLKKELDEGSDEQSALSLIYKDKAALYPEFSKILCISVGKITELSSVDTNIIIDNDEKKILSLFVKNVLVPLIERAKTNKNTYGLIGWNILNFDIPFLLKRLVYNGIKIPDGFWQTDAKPWERLLKHTDIMKDLMFDSYEVRHRISLDMACEMFGVESPKKEVSSHIWIHNLIHSELPWEEKKEQLTNYCNADVTATGQIAIKLLN